MKIFFESNQIESITKEILLPLIVIKKYKILAFKGPLGVGKTTLIKKLLFELGVKDLVTSPTFNYVNTYKSIFGKIFHHFDLYRIGSIDNFINSGFDEYLYKNIFEGEQYLFIEWPEIIESLLLDDTIKNFVCVIELDYIDSYVGKRVLELKFLN